MIATPFFVELLTAHHNREAFDCGETSLNDYLKCYARQNMRNDSARVYVAVRPEPKPALLCARKA